MQERDSESQSEDAGARNATQSRKTRPRKTSVREGISMDHLERTRLLLGEEAIDKLRKSRVAVFGIGEIGRASCRERV